MLRMTTAALIVASIATMSGCQSESQPAAKKEGAKPAQAAGQAGGQGSGQGAGQAQAPRSAAPVTERMNSSSSDDVKQAQAPARAAGGQAPARQGATQSPAPSASNFKITSTAFANDTQMPVDYTVDGKDVSPPLAWSGAPEGTKEFAIICRDPTAGRGGGFVHWVIYDIPADVTSLPEGLARDGVLTTPVRAKQGFNSWRTRQGYWGPAGGIGRRHQYHFTVYALGEHLDLEPGLNAQQLQEAMEGKVLAEATVVGINVRKPKEEAKPNAAAPAVEPSK